MTAVVALGAPHSTHHETPPRGLAVREGVRPLGPQIRNDLGRGAWLARVAAVVAVQPGSTCEDQEAPRHRASRLIVRDGVRDGYGWWLDPSGDHGSTTYVAVRGTRGATVPVTASLVHPSKWFVAELTAVHHAGEGGGLVVGPGSYSNKKTINSAGGRPVRGKAISVARKGHGGNDRRAEPSPTATSAAGRANHPGLDHVTTTQPSWPTGRLFIPLIGSVSVHGD